MQLNQSFGKSGSATWWWDLDDRCPFCIVWKKSAMTVTSLLYPNIKKFVYIKAIPKFCDKHLNQVVDEMKEKVDKIPKRYKNGVFQFRDIKYLEALKIEQVCRVL